MVLSTSLGNFLLDSSQFHMVTISQSNFFGDMPLYNLKKKKYGTLGLSVFKRKAIIPSSERISWASAQKIERF